MLNVRPVLFGLALAGLLLPAVGLLSADEAPSEPPAATETKIPWVRNWAEAQALAKKDGKDLLIDFTGSDWCGYCVKLEGEVFSQAAFLDVATKQFVFVFLDFPRGAEPKKAVVDPALNSKLSQDYGVGGYPTIILATAQGLPYGRMGYQEGGPEGYLPDLAEKRAQGEQIKALLAKGKTDFAVFKTGFKSLEESGFLGFPAYSWVIDQAEAKDKDGSQGLKAAVERERARQRSEVEEKALMALVEGKGGENMPWAEVHAFLKKSKDLSGDLLMQASIAVGDWLLKTENKPDEAKVMYELPLRDPDLAGNPRAKALIAQRVLGCEKPAEPAAEPAPEPDAPETPK